MSFQDIIDRFPEVSRQVLAVAYNVGLNDAYAMLHARGTPLGKAEADTVMVLADLADRILNLRVQDSPEPAFPSRVLTPPMKHPQTKSDWQEAVDWAQALLILEQTLRGPLVTGGPTIDVERCHQVLKEGVTQGVTPNPQAFENFLNEWQQDT